VLLARALAVQAQVLLMDEPLANLDPPHQADWLGIVRALVEQGVTVVSVLHEVSMALHADDMVIMATGACCTTAPRRYGGRVGRRSEPFARPWHHAAPHHILRFARTCAPECAAARSAGCTGFGPSNG
jgi:energy-coupling factor transporter ATP-binding protein EcfA2